MEYLQPILSGILIGVSAADPPKFIVVPRLLTAGAIFDCWIPAKRATKIDLMVALRRE